MSPQEFIRQVLMTEIKDVVYQHKYHFLSFGLVCNGIEFLGKCIDPTAAKWSSYKRYGFHFKRGLTLMPGYSNHEKELYEALRCGFAHGLVPGKQIALTHRQESQREGTTHMAEHGGRRVLVIEEFYDDFVKACEDVLHMSFPSGDKMNRDLLGIS